MLFTGETDRAIDDKHRLSIPTEHRAQLAGQLPAVVYATPGPNGGIWVWPEETFIRMAANLEDTLLPDDDEMDIVQVLFSQSQRLELDKTGRIRLPASLMELAGIGSHAVVLGARDHLELCDPEEWAKVKPQKLAAMREIMQRKAAGRRGRGT
jgi:MraZ protein